MEQEERIERLEAAHNALAAQVIALRQVIKAMLPLIDAPEDDVRRTLLYAYDGLSEYMETHSMDGTFQRDAREAIDDLVETVLLGADIRATRSSGPPENGA